MLNRRIRLGCASIFVIALSSQGLAFAQDEEETPMEGEEAPADETGEGTAPTEEAAPADDAAAGEAAAEAGGMHGITLGKGKVNIDVQAEIGLNDGNSGDPFSISPDITYGVSDKLDLALIHSGMGTTGFVGAQTGASLCVSGDTCDAVDVYHNVGLEGRFALKNDGPFGVGVNGGLFALNFDPDLLLAVKLGLFGRYTAGKIMLMFSPNIFIGVTERDLGNEEFLNIPVMAIFMATPQLGIGLQTGIAGPLDGFGDAYNLPVSLGAHFMATPQIGIGAAFSLPAVVLGGETDQATDFRTITIWANYTLGGSTM
jgi:hypothetical protein